MNQDASVAKTPQGVSELLERLDNTFEDLPKRLQQCASFTRRHLHLIAVSTVSEMAVACGVAPSVYMRFCQALGFSGYSEMQELFRVRYTEFRPDYEERFATLFEDDTIGSGRLLADFAESSHKSLMYLSNTVTSESMDRIAKGLASARVVHLVGLRRAFAVVSNMSYLFDKMGVPSNLHYSAGMLDTTSTILPGDALFAVTFAPFSEETIQLASRTAERGILLYGLTDSERCPVGQWADQMLIAREDEIGGFRGLSASITLSTALAVAIGAMRKNS